MKILVTGRDGQVGWELQRSLAVLGEVVAVGRAQVDFADAESVRRCVRTLQPDLIVNAAAYTAVDRAETEALQAFAINAEAPGVLAREAAALGAGLIHYSTDYVYDGSKRGAWVEADPVAPLGAYGRSKLAGEQAIAAAGAAHLVLRTSWVYASRGANFLRTMLRLAREREELRVVADQFGAPTWARCIAEATAAVVARAGTGRAAVAAALGERGGVFHLSCAGQTSWHGFAVRIFQRIEDPQRRLRTVAAIGAADYPTPARRPANSVLDNGRLERAWGVRLPAWDQALAMCAADMGGG